ncbi:MAG: hypothetical protein JWM33_2388 [Caulobacteraceae bacterium]|nr:hypothetical protein [Caulobacteraceae bacterium]
MSLREIMMKQHVGRMVRGLTCALFLALGACGQPATAQSFEDFGDDVLLYVRDGQSDHPSIVLYDAKAVQANAAAKHPVVELTLNFSEATERWDYRAAIDDRFDELLKGAPARLAATHTEPQQGRRSYLFVSAEPARVAAALEGIAPPSGITATSRTLKASELEVWGPTPLEFQDAQDERVRQSLAKHGDDGTKPRMVEFFFYGGDHAALRAAAKQQGFQTREAEGDRTGVILSRQTAVDSKTLAVLNGQFISWSNRFGAEYDGWETEVAKK